VGTWSGIVLGVAGPLINGCWAFSGAAGTGRGRKEGVAGAAAGAVAGGVGVAGPGLESFSNSTNGVNNCFKKLIGSELTG